MKFEAFETRVHGAKIISGEMYADDRGRFCETVRHEEFLALGLPVVWAQENVSMSFAGVLRGMHIQKKDPQGKLVRAVHGTILDAWVDLRPESPTFKKWEILTLSSERNEAVWLPPGLAHGFLCLSKIAVVQYNCTTAYDKANDGGIRWDDAELKIEWPFSHEFTPHVSPKDMNLPTVREYLGSLG